LVPESRILASAVGFCWQIVSSCSWRCCRMKALTCGLI
jgi:hypothetical protein